MCGVLAVLAAQLFIECLEFPSKLDHPLCGCLVPSAELSTISALVFWTDTQMGMHSLNRPLKTYLPKLERVKYMMRKGKKKKKSKKKGAPDSTYR